jgi:hypothetical protein
MIGAGGGVALLAPFVAIAAEGDQLLATVDKPAILTAAPSAGLASPAPDPSAPQVSAPQVIVHVTGYQPPQQGAVRGVVKLQKPDGTEQEIGTFGVFPDTAFKAASSRARSYRFALPKDLATGPVKLKIEIVPDKAQGTGEGARLEVGGAEIQ